jgi:hypothetical protein
VRTERRQRLGERFRTLLGHFRHETGHYFPRDERSGGRFVS